MSSTSSSESSSSDLSDFEIDKSQQNHVNSKSQVKADKQDVFEWTNRLECDLIEAVNKQDTSVRTAYNKVTIDWGKVSSEIRVPEDKCKNRWKQLLSKVRHYRTLAEVSSDMIALQEMKIQVAKTQPKPKPTKSAKQTPNPDHPKKPKTSGYNVFCEERGKDLPPSSGLTRFIELGKMWKEVSDDEKAHYNLICLQKKKQYIDEVEKYAKAHPKDETIQQILAELVKHDTLKKTEKEITKLEEEKSKMSMKTEQGKREEMKSPKKRLFSEAADEDEAAEMSQSSTSSPKKKKKKKSVKWTAESVFFDVKYSDYQIEHADLTEEEITEKLRRVFNKQSDKKKAKYERLAAERNG